MPSSTASTTCKTTAPSSPLRKLAAALMIAAGFGFMACLFSSVLTTKNAANRDFISYWAAGQQLVRGANPYDRAAIAAIERSQGTGSDLIMIMRNPPLAFFLAWPLGFHSAKTALVLWSLLQLAGLSLVNWIIWMINGRPDSRLHLLGYLFAPTLACQLAGQIGIFLLLGIVLFLWLHRTHPYLAGFALLLCAMKPHLFLPVFLILLLWSLQRRDLRILGGFAAAVLASCVFAFIVDRQAWQQYSQMMQTAGILSERMPALSVVFAQSIAGLTRWPPAAWLRFLPEACACLWALRYFWTRRGGWNWNEQGLLLLLVAVACSPYALFTDESLLLPAIMAGLYRAVDKRRSPLPLAVLVSAALVEVLAGVPIVGLGYIWTMPAWLAWYLYAAALKPKSAQPATHP